MIQLDLSILNQKGTPMFNSDLLANRPSPAVVGRIFIAIDAPFGLFRDTGSVWEQIAGSGGGGGNTIYTANDTLTANRVVSSGGFSLTFNPSTTFASTLTAPSGSGAFAAIALNTLSYAAAFSSSNLGNVYAAIGGINLQTFAGSATFSNANLAAANISVNSVDFSSGGSTITMTQASGLRVMAGHQNQFQYQGTNSGTITHAATSQNLGFFRPPGATGILTITNAYSHLINDLNDYGSGFVFTNRFGIFQAGASDTNFLAANLLIGTLVNTGQKLQVVSDSLISGLTIGKGGSSVSTNTAIGFAALSVNTTGAGNTSIGINALKLNTTGSSNTSIGANALSANTTAANNTAIGNGALRDITTGGSNIAIGSGAMLLSTTGNSNIAIGNAALNISSGINNIAVGTNSMANATTGGNNSAYGNSTMNSAVTGNFNNSFGVSSMSSLTSGEQNTGLGNSALFSNTTGSNNTALGRALQGNTTGSNNISIGWTSGFYNTTENNQLYISSLFFASLAESRTNSIIYGVQNAAASSQILRINAATGIGLSANPVASAQLQVDSTTKGLLAPRMTNGQILAIATPAEGLMAYNTTISHMCVYQAGAWVKLSHSPM